MMPRFSLCICLFSTALIAGCATKSPAPEAPAVSSVTTTAPGSVKQANVATMSAIVENVDVAKRLVTLRTSDGETTTIRVGDEVKNLPQVRKGDEVSVGYLESVAIEVKKPSEGELGAVAAEDVETAKPGEKPAGVAARTVMVTAKIVGIDRAAQKVTLEGKEGNRVTIDVRNPAHFDAIAVGDLVEITYTEALAISVDSVKPK
jgi:hypothetical protein